MPTFRRFGSTRKDPLTLAVGAAALLGIAAACGDSGNESDRPAQPLSAVPPPPPPPDAAAPRVDGVEPPAPLPTSPAPPVPPPTAADGVKNGTETDVDCGGPSKGTPRCERGRSCVTANDCITKHCASTVCAQLAPSCTGATGTTSCGLGGGDNCCASSTVPGGSYNRFAQAAYPATVSAFELDRFEVTVGRLRAFFEAKGGNLRGSPPAPGAGAHPKVANSGWRSSFNARLPGSWTEINDRLGAAGCSVGGDNSDGGAATWTSAPGPYEDLPITCIDWYTLFAFCAWDGGRLPTDAEWGFAAMGGDQQRLYAWSAPGDSGNLTWGIHDSLVVASLWDPAAQVFKFSVGGPFRLTDPVSGKVNDGPAHMSPPGRKSGYGRWGQADLTGNVLELLLDNAPIPEGTCNDCAFVDWPDPPQDQVGAYPPQWFTPGTNQSPDGYRSTRGGSWDPTHVPYTHYYYAYAIARTYYAAGGRCARD